MQGLEGVFVDFQCAHQTGQTLNIDVLRGGLEVADFGEGYAALFRIGIGVVVFNGREADVVVGEVTEEPHALVGGVGTIGTGIVVEEVHDALRQVELQYLTFARGGRFMELEVEAGEFLVENGIVVVDILFTLGVVQQSLCKFHGQFAVGRTDAFLFE